MTRQDMAQYLVNLLAIMDSKERSGRDRGGALATEYIRIYDELLRSIKKEDDNETRNSERQRTA